MASESAWRVRAPAKINLLLRVVGVRPDGYHELRTVFQSVALCDTLEIWPRPGAFELCSDDPACPVDETNLVWRAAARVWSVSGHRGAPRDVVVWLRKGIPAQAGLGGGSSDGAAALRAFGRLWRVDEARLRQVATGLGADVPYFFEGGAVLGLDRGDQLFALAEPARRWVALAVPAFGVSTRDAFGWWDALHLARPEPRQARASRRPAGLDRYQTGNDLERAVVAHHPEIRKLVRAFTAAGAIHAAMSGSGSAVFGLFDARAQAVRAAAAVSGRARWTWVGRTLNRAAYQRLAAVTVGRIHLPFAPRSPGRS